MMRRLISMAVLVFSVTLVACTAQAPNKEQVPPTAQKPAVERDALGRTAADVEAVDLQSRIKSARYDFGIEKRPATDDETKKTKGQNDVLCDGLMSYLEVRGGLRTAAAGSWYFRGRTFDSKPFTAEDWMMVGTTDVAMMAKEREQANAFLKLLAPIVSLSAPQRAKLEESWDHTCDGMLRPTEADKLVDDATETVRESNLEVTLADAGFRRAAMANYRGRFAAVLKQEKLKDEHSDDDLSDNKRLLRYAFVWGTAKDFGLPDSFVEKYKGEGKP